MLGELTALIERYCEDHEGLRSTAIPNLTLFRATVPEMPINRLPAPEEVDPCLCVVVQGSKQATLGTRPIMYEPHHYLVISVDLPATNILVHATPAKPFLGLRLKLDSEVLSEMLLIVEAEDARQIPGWCMKPGLLSHDLTSCLERLVNCLEDPTDAMVVAPLVEREIAYRLLRGPQAQLLRQIAQADSRLSQVRRAIAWLRKNYAKQIRIEDAADVAGMSLSTFHEHFKAVTSMSPLQYQKHLRLHAARRMIVTGQSDVTNAAFAVGYDSPSQFNREYKRLFGAPPLRDISKLRSLMLEQTEEVA